MRTYDPRNVIVSIGGSPIQGFAPDSFVEVERESEGFTDVVGASGEVARAKSNDHRGSIKLSLLATSAYNDILSDLAVADELTAEGVVAVMVKELNGTTLAAAAEAWIQKLPAIKRGKEVSTVDYVIRCSDLQIFAGGMVG